MSYRCNAYLAKAKEGQLAIIAEYIVQYKKLSVAPSRKTAAAFQLQIADMLEERLAGKSLEILLEMQQLHIAVPQSFREQLLAQERLLSLLFVTMLRDEAQLV